MPSPSSCGFPDATTVGVVPGVTRTAASGTVTLSTAGQVYENKTLNGDIVVKAQNVTIRNVKIIAPGGGYHMISVMPGGSWERTDANLTVDHVEFDLGGQLGASGGGDFQPIAYNGFTVTNSYFHNGSDCAALGSKVVIRDSLCAVGPDANANGWPDGGAYDGGTYNRAPSWCSGGGQHFDGFQSDGGDGIELTHNTIRNPCGQTSAILMSSNTSPIRNITINRNLMAGGGWTLYCGGDNDPNRITTEQVQGNRFSRIYWPGAGYYGAAAHCEPGYIDNGGGGNVWDDTGAALGF